jgi:hypothetical protein
MSHFWQGRSASGLPDGVSEDLDKIERYVRGTNLYRLFNEKVKGICKKKKKPVPWIAGSQ